MPKHQGNIYIGKYVLYDISLPGIITLRRKGIKLQQ